MRFMHRGDTPRTPRKLKNIHLWQFINVSLLSGLVLLLVYVLFFPVDVLKSDTWTLTVQGSTHYPGDILSVTSRYEKVRDVTGVAKRSIECQNQQKAYIRYPINEAEANRLPSGSVGIGVLLPVPINIPVPTECKITINVDYEIFKIGSFVLRHHHEYNESGHFMLLPRPVGADPKGDSSLNVELNNVPVDNSQPSKIPAASSQDVQQTQQEQNAEAIKNAAAEANEPSEPFSEPGQDCRIDFLGIKLFCKDVK